MIKHHRLQELQCYTVLFGFFKKFSPKAENKQGRISLDSTDSYPHLTTPSINRHHKHKDTHTLNIAESS